VEIDILESLDRSIVDEGLDPNFHLWLEGCGIENLTTNGAC
jgi:hypothetical protein